MKIAILDYESLSVFVTNIPELETGDEIEAYIEEKLGYKIKDIGWLTADNLKVSIDI